jgi:antitoxin component YwqK of YwqJK toxin-antitoxin module
MFEELTKHTRFIVVCNIVVSDYIIKWFELKNIKLKLFEEYKNICGNQYWYKNGLKHRENDLPAIIYNDGTQIWYQNGKLHRENNMPAVIWPDGTQFYYKNGVFCKRSNIYF